MGGQNYIGMFSWCVLTYLTSEVDKVDLGSCVVETTKEDQEEEEESNQGKNWNKEINNKINCVFNLDEGSCPHKVIYWKKYPRS